MKGILAINQRTNDYDCIGTMYRGYTEEASMKHQPIENNFQENKYRELQTPEYYFLPHLQENIEA